jgi:hypothetical protein
MVVRRAVCRYERLWCGGLERVVWSQASRQVSVVPHCGAGLKADGLPLHVAIIILRRCEERLTRNFEGRLQENITRPNRHKVS